MKSAATLRLIGNPHAYYPNLAKPFGGLTSAILFSQIFYWQDKANSELGVYKTRDDLEEETGLTHDEQRTAIKKLVSIGVLIVTEKRLEHKTYYRIDEEKLNEILDNFALSKKGFSRDGESGAPEVDNVEFGESTLSSSLDQEITTKITKTHKHPIVPLTKKSEFDLSLFEQEPSKSVWQDYLEHRKNKKAKLTETALNRLVQKINAANKLGYATDDILAECMLRNWQGFEVSWIEQKNYQRNSLINEITTRPSNPERFVVING